MCVYERRAPYFATRHSGEPACWTAHRQHREIARALQLVFYASLLSPNPTAALKLISYRPTLFRSRFSPHSPQWRPPLLPQWRVSCAPLHQTSTCILCTCSSWIRVTLFVTQNRLARPKVQGEETPAETHTHTHTHPPLSVHPLHTHTHTHTALARAIPRALRSCRRFRSCAKTSTERSCGTTPWRWVCGDGGW